MVPFAILYHSLIDAIPVMIPILCWYQNPHGTIHLVVPSAYWCQLTLGAKGFVTNRRLYRHPLPCNQPPNAITTLPSLYLYSTYKLYTLQAYSTYKLYPLQTYNTSRLPLPRNYTPQSPNLRPDRCHRLYTPGNSALQARSIDHPSRETH